MDAASLVKLLGGFTGLYAGDDMIDSVRKHTQQCSPHGRGRPPSTYKTLSYEEKLLYNRSKARLTAERSTYDAFFAPYNDLLSDLVGDPAFGWRTTGRMPTRPDVTGARTHVTVHR